MIRSFIVVAIFLISTDSISGTIFINGKVGLLTETKSGMDFEIRDTDYIGCPVVKVILSDNKNPFSVQIKINQLKLYSAKSWDVAVSTNLQIEDCTIVGNIIKTEARKPLNISIW